MKKIIYSIIAIMLFVLGKFLLREDLIPFLKWWLAIAVIGMAFLPITTLLFSSFHDKGYLFSKTIGIAVSGYFMWSLSSAHLMKFTEVSTLITIGISMLINVVVIFFCKKYQTTKTQHSILSFAKDGTLDHMIVEELMFLGIFLLFTYIRCFKPEAYGTEKFMDYGFMTSMMRSDYMPVEDFWFAGTSLNYYYVGQFFATYLTKVSFVEVAHGYNLMLMMIGAFAFLLPYSLVYNIVQQFMKENNKSHRGVSTISGIVAGAGVCIAGNMHYPMYRWIEPIVRKFFGMEAGTKKYWFPNATRFIGYHPETNDKTIHEFPAYSFVLGDLHAHVINVLFVITILGILYAWLCNRKKITEVKPPLWKEVFHPAIILVGFYIGLFHTTNYWDFPIYFVVSGAVILFSNMVVYKLKGKIILLTALQGVFVIAIAKIISLPFTLNFNTISTKIRLAVAHTPINQMVILWGLPVFVVIVFLLSIMDDFFRNRKELQKINHEKQKTTIVQFMGELSTSDLFIAILGLCAIGLILIPEIIYVEDIYSGDYKRANTMFKLTYQAFIMFGICFGCILCRLLWFGKTKRQKKLAGTGLFLFVLTLFYIQNAVNSWYGNIFDRSGYVGLDATTFMETTMPDDELATNWLNDNVTGMPVVLEANGDSYTDYQRVSVMTGLPTVLGWRTHEWLWKSDTTILDERAADIQQIYTSTDEYEVRRLIQKYKISYIYVGDLEQEKYGVVNHELLKSLGELVFPNPLEDKNYETYIIQVDN